SKGAWTNRKEAPVAAEEAEEKTKVWEGVVEVEGKVVADHLIFLED
ncbi:MAG: hypothetical protein JRE64_25175, partial [Deltaproteobacteria bacterium]|nr:hypothetical protein [Deltaproteobacteria bacterium]